MKIYDVVVIGGGPAGLGAAIKAAGAGASVLLLDENHTLGGQLFKQIHKFFGSKDHYAGTRGTDIGQNLLKEAAAAGVNIRLNSKVVGYLDDKSIGVYNSQAKKLMRYQGKKIVLAIGAKENAINFPGWTLPGVMTAGAAQTFANVHGVLPGKRMLMIGSGNVGLIVSYQLLQAGADVVAIVDALPKVNGYGVHAGKVSKAGVPFYLSHTITKASGKNRVERAVIAEVDSSFNPISGTEKEFAVDTVLLAVGLTPREELATLFGCALEYDGRLGGHLTIHDQNMESSVPGVYVCGDLAGVEEASTALEEGRLAGIAAAESLGCIERDRALKLKEEIWERLNCLRMGAFGDVRREAKQALIELAQKENVNKVVQA